jgi:DNA methylase
VPALGNPSIDVTAALTPGPIEVANLGPNAATFRSAKKLPVHRWFPWIEGFSEDIPLIALSRHSPRLVYDPFMGSGTTAVVSVLHGTDAAGAEVNPFLRFVASTKTNAARVVRDLSASEVLAAAAAVAENARGNGPQANVAAALKENDYFTDVALDWISRIKSAIETTNVPHAALRDLFRLAFASTLVGSSNMVRRTDLRRRRVNEKATDGGNLLLLFEQACWSMAHDVAHLPSDMGQLRLLTDDARVLHGELRGQVDVCVTSPPYLNGTNYARNTKLELWILDFISSASDLAALHHAAISAGINSARHDESLSTGDTELDRTVAELERTAYDRRIPRMVAGYFRDMALGLQATADALRPGGYLYLDIGDSKFGGVHVATDSILTRSAAACGLTLREHVDLRVRRSKDGSPLRQVLLVFESRRSKKQPDDRRRLRKLVSSRIFQQPPYGARNWGHSWHSMCSYQAKLKPSIAHFLVKEFTSPGDVVLDPFGGSGAIPLEANLQGRHGWGNDINPLAIHLLKAKSSQPVSDDVWATFEDLTTFIDESSGDFDAEAKALGSFGFNGPLVSYYHPLTMQEILAARHWLASASDAPAVSLVSSAMAHILHGNRPYALSRRSHPITPFAPTGPTELRTIEPRLRAKITRLLETEMPAEWADGRATAFDARELADAGSADVVITSPPFYGSTRFHVNNWIRLWFCGWNPEEFDALRHNFLEVQQSRSFAIYEDIFKSLHGALRRGGLAVWHLGLSKRKDMGAELAALAPPLFEVVALETESVDHCQSHGVTSQGVTLAHQFLILRSL